MMYQDRKIHAKAKRLLSQFPVLVILGARQVGKSTFAQQLGDDWLYLDLENPTDASRVLDNSELFFEDYPHQVILDEAQSKPEIFNILRGVVDKNCTKKGRFILTGSASFELMSSVSESLAGRVAIIEMHPMSQKELNYQYTAPSKLDSDSFWSLFNQPLNASSIKSLIKIKATHSGTLTTRKAMLNGGYPEPALSDDHNFKLDWYDNYFSTYIQRDILNLYPKLDLLKYRRVVQMLSQVSNTIINRSEIARSVESSEKSIRDYLDIIKGTYFWRELPAYQTTKIKTTTKLAKGHFRDIGLNCYLQHIHNEEQLATWPRLGDLFESFVVEEIIRNVETSQARSCQYWHFRTKSGAEIDLLLEGSFGLLPIEIKYSSHTKKGQVKALQQFIDLHQLPLGIVINHCPQASRISENIIQIPVSCLF